MWLLSFAGWIRGLSQSVDVMPVIADSFVPEPKECPSRKVNGKALDDTFSVADVLNSS